MCMVTCVMVIRYFLCNIPVFESVVFNTHLHTTHSHTHTHTHTHMHVHLLCSLGGSIAPPCDCITRLIPSPLMWLRSILVSWASAETPAASLHSTSPAHFLWVNIQILTTNIFLSIKVEPHVRLWPKHTYGTHTVICNTPILWSTNALLMRVNTWTNLATVPCFVKPS